MSQELLGVIQTIGVLSAVYASFTAYRSRDDRKTERLAEMQAAIRAVDKRLEKLEALTARAHAPCTRTEREKNMERRSA